MRKQRGLDVGLRGHIRSYGDAKGARRLVLGIMGAVVISYVFEPEKVAKKEFERLAVEYFEDYFYPKFVEEIPEERWNERMQFYSKVGVQDVTLQQVLAYNMGMNRGSEKYFSRKGFSCDKKETYAKFFPEEPFGVEDYRVEFYYKCTETE